MIMTGANDLYGVGQLEAACSALIATDEREHVLTDWRPIHEQMRIASRRLFGCLRWSVGPPGEKTWRPDDNALDVDCGPGIRRRLRS
jgi:hypothetical protein